jgi:hypothetical protein
MAYEIYTPSGCDAEIGDHYCNTCEEPEHGRVRSVAYIKKGFEFNDPSDPTEWEAGIASKDIIIIPEVNGTFDGGAEVEVPGYGDQATKLVGYNFGLQYNDPNYKNNAAFYNAIKRSRNYRLAFRTETQIHLTENSVSVVPKNPVTDDVTSEVVWAVGVKWAEGDLPQPFDVPVGIFSCFAYTGNVV